MDTCNSLKRSAPWLISMPGTFRSAFESSKVNGNRGRDASIIISEDICENKVKVTLHKMPIFHLTK